MATDHGIDPTKDYEYEVRLEVTARLRVPGIAVTRVLENHDDEGIPQPDTRGGTGWRNTMYDLQDEESVVRMLAHNMALRSLGLHQLDGWADLEDRWEWSGSIEDIYVEDFTRTEIPS